MPESSPRPAPVLPLATGILLAPLAFLMDLQASYLLQGTACDQHSNLLQHLASLIALFLTLMAGYFAWRSWQQAGGKPPGEEGGAIPRTRFLAALGIAESAFFILVLLANDIPKLLLHPCQ